MLQKTESIPTLSCNRGAPPQAFGWGSTRDRPPPGPEARTACWAPSGSPGTHFRCPKLGQQRWLPVGQLAPAPLPLPCSGPAPRPPPTDPGRPEVSPPRLCRPLIRGGCAGRGAGDSPSLQTPSKGRGAWAGTCPGTTRCPRGPPKLTPPHPTPGPGPGTRRSGSGSSPGVGGERGLSWKSGKCKRCPPPLSQWQLRPGGGSTEWAPRGTPIWVGQVRPTQEGCGGSSRSPTFASGVPWLGAGFGEGVAGLEATGREGREAGWPASGKERGFAPGLAGSPSSRALEHGAANEPESERARERVPETEPSSR